MSHDNSQINIGFSSAALPNAVFSIEMTQKPLSTIEESPYVHSKKPLNTPEILSLTKNVKAQRSMFNFDDIENLAAVPRLQQYINLYSLCTIDRKLVKEYSNYIHLEYFYYIIYKQFLTLTDNERCYFNSKDIAGVKFEEFAQFEHIVNEWRMTYDSAIPLIEINDDSDHTIEDLFLLLSAKNSTDIQNQFDKLADFLSNMSYMYIFAPLNIIYFNFRFMDEIILKFSKITNSLLIISNDLVSKILEAELGLTSPTPNLITIITNVCFQLFYLFILGLVFAQ